MFTYLFFNQGLNTYSKFSCYYKMYKGIQNKIVKILTCFHNKNPFNKLIINDFIKRGKCAPLNNIMDILELVVDKVKEITILFGTMHQKVLVNKSKL